MLLCAFVLLVTLFVGLKPKGFRFSNQVELRGDGSGMVFPNYGMVASRRTLGDAGVSDSLSLAFTIAPRRTGRQLSKILSLVDGKGRALLEVEQWTTMILVSLWGPDGRRIGKVGIQDALSAGTPRSLVITVDDGELGLSVDESAGLRESRSVVIPADFFKDCRLLIGLSPTGRDPWHGEMTELGIFRGAVSAGEIADFQARRPGRYGLQAFAMEKPLAAFTFAQSDGRTIADGSGKGWDLDLPAYPRLFKYEVLIVDPGNPFSDRGLTFDMIVNYLGFFPFGACFFMGFRSFAGSGKRALALTVGCAFLVSLGIELAQVFIPTRTSQLLDLALNTIGALSAAAAAYALTRKKA